MAINATGYPAADAGALVVDGYNNYTEIGEDWADEARAALSAIDNFSVTPISFGASFNIADWNTSFVRPTKPEAPAVPSVSPTAVPLPDLDPIALQLLGEAPAEPNLEALLAYAPPAPPTAAAPTEPANTTVVLDPIVVPDAPDYVLPEVPTLFDLNLPDVPDIVLPEFDGVRPTFNIPDPPDGELDWQEVAYSSVLKDELTAKIRDMLQGSLGLPLAVEQALFDRGRAREDRTSRKLVMEITEDMASRNLTEPNGILGKRLQQARESNRDNVGNLNREVTIESAKLAIENVRFAVGQGMALEQALMQQNMAINERGLRASLAVLDYGLQRVNAMVAIGNLQQQAYATDAQVWRQRIEGALATLEVYKAELEGQRITGEINKQLIDRYEAQHRAVAILAEIYKTDVAAAKERGEINLQRIEAAKLELQRYGLRIDAWGKGWEGYKAQVDASLGTARFADILANVYATRMQGYRTKGEAFFQEAQTQIARNGQSLDLLRARLQASDQDLRAQLASVDAVLRTFQARTQMYEAEGSVVQAEAAAIDRTQGLRIEAERSRTSVLLENARIALDQAMKIADLQLSALQGKAQVYGQLVASSQSAVSLGANISGSGSMSSSWGASWSGEAPDYTGPTTFN